MQYSKVKISIIIYILVIFPFSQTFSQNLVKNPSFEEYFKLPTNLAQYLSYVKYWDKVKGSSSYFHRKGGEEDGFVFRVPINSIGNQDARTGDAYINMILINYNKGYSVIQGQLKEPLVKEHKYYFEMYLSMVDNLSLQTSNLWVAFSDSVFRGTEYKSYYLNFPKQIVNDTSNYFYGKENWTKFSGTFVANGGEKYLAIGSITNVVNVQGKTNHNHRSEYFVDDVSLIDIGDKLYIETGKPLVLKNINFNTGKSVLLSSSYPELNKLLEYLNDNPLTKVEVSGHTDNTGDEAKNVLLSEERAKSVIKYLTNQGISENRLTFKGYGSSKPIDTNETPEGRTKNRRVEVKIINN